jgi:hypothetical protein
MESTFKLRQLKATSSSQCVGLCKPILALLSLLRRFSEVVRLHGIAIQHYSRRLRLDLGDLGPQLLELSFILCFSILETEYSCYLLLNFTCSRGLFTFGGPDRVRAAQSKMMKFMNGRIYTKQSLETRRSLRSCLSSTS